VVREETCFGAMEGVDPTFSMAHNGPLNLGVCSLDSYPCPFQGNTKIGAEAMSPNISRMGGEGGEGIGAGGMGARRAGEGPRLTRASSRA
jgi:hypothetical protein